MEELWGASAVAISESPAEMRPPAAALSISPRWVLLVVGSDPELARGLERGLARRGYGLRANRDGASALVALQQERPDGVVLDLANAAVPDRVRLLQRIRDIDATIPVIVLASPTASRGALTADAIRAGAVVLAPPAPPEVVHAAFQQALGAQRQADALAHYCRREERRAGLEQLLGESIPMLRLKTQVRLLLDAEERCGEAPAVLLQGDSGTGKGEVARALHFDGARRHRPFIRVDVEDLAAPDSEVRLFGRERAVPGAAARCSGLVHAADGGTLYISDLGNLAPSLQSRFVSLLEQGTVRRAGGAREVPVDVRVVAATRCRHEALSRAGWLRPELHRRLAGVPLQLPPLRERGEDIWLLADRFVKGAAERRGVPPPRLNGGAKELLSCHAWPGNVRELRHVLERAALVQTDGTIDGTHLEFALAPRPATPPLPGPPTPNLQRLEREALAQALLRAYGNVSQAARLLGISRDTMRYRIARHALGTPRARR